MEVGLTVLYIYVLTIYVFSPLPVIVNENDCHFAIFK